MYYYYYYYYYYLTFQIALKETDETEQDQRLSFLQSTRSARYSVDHGCLPFTTFLKFRLESKWYTPFRVVPVENFREQRNV